MLCAALEMTMTMTMTMTMRLVLAAMVVGWLWVDVVVVMGDVGTATSYDPPYLSTRCPGYNRGRFPGDGLFVAASNGVWDNGTACGQKYRLRCLSTLRRPWKGHTIIVEVVDVCRNNPCPSMLALSNKAFEAISRINTKINIEFTQI